MKYALFAFWLIIATSSSFAQSLDRMIEQAETRLNHDDWLRATEDFKSILDNHSATLSSIQKAKIYNDLGYLSMRLLDTEDADYYLNLAIITHEEAGLPDKIAYASALQNMSQFYLQRVQFDLAKSYIDQAIEVIVADKGKENADYALARTKLAQVFEEVGYYDLAYEVYYDSHEALKNLSAFSPGYAEACSHMGRILIRKGEPAKAEEFINESTVIYQQLGKDYDVERAESLEGLGNFYEQLGRYEEAEEILLQALSIKRSIPNEANILIIETLNDLGILYRHLGDDIKSEQMFLEVVKECEEELTTDHPFYATAKNNLATIAMQNDDYAKAQTLLEDALETYDKKYGPNHPLSANTVNNLARVYKQLGKDDLAEEYYKRVLTLDERLYGKNHPDYATTLMNLAILYSSSGREEKAEPYYREALEIRKEVLGENHPSYFRALENVGLQSMAQNKMEEAESYFRQTIEIQIGQIETLFPAMSVREKEDFYDRLRGDIDRYNYVVMSLLDSRPELIKNVFDYQLKTKSILFTPSEKVNNRIVNGNNPELRNQYFSWLEEKKLLANYYRIGVQRLYENNIDLEEIENRIRGKERIIAANMSDFATILPNISTNWNSIQQKINDDEAVVEIVKIREFKSQTHGDGIVFGFTNLTQYLAIVLTKNTINGPQYAVLGDGFKADKDWYRLYTNSLTRSDDNEVFRQLWGPVHQLMGSAQKVRVSPDGIFNKVNPNLFKVSNSEYVIDKYFVSYVTNCNDLLRDAPETLSKRSFLFGNPDFRGTAETDNLRLPALMTSELEINSLAALLEPKGWDAKVFARKEATELRIKSAYNPTILHIATHGYFYDSQEFLNIISGLDNPQFKSGLFLTGASKTYDSYVNGIQSNSLNDGILTAYEAMSLDLNRTELIVLAASDANGNTINSQEGLFGLQRAFTVAGARNIVANFSNENEQAASELMVLFYHKYMETENVGESLKFAQMKIRTKYTDPKIWGSFMLIGNG